MSILIWIYFITASIGYIISLIGSIINIENDEEDNVILFNFSNFITIGLVFYTTLSLFSNTVALIILWSLLGIAILLSLYTVYKFIWGDDTVSVFHKIIAIIILCVLVATALISFRLNISSTIIDASIGDKYKSIIPLVEIILILWIPLMIVLLIYWKIKTKSNQNKEYNSLYYSDIDSENAIHKLHSLYQEFIYQDRPLVYFMERAEMYIQHSNISREMGRTILRNMERLYNRRMKKILSVSEFRELILYNCFDSLENNNYSFENTYLLENITERIQTIMKKEFSRSNKRDYDYNSINNINSNIEELKHLLAKQNATNDSDKQSTINTNNSSSAQQQFIKELFHCLMTPISQVDASLSTVKAKLPQADEVLDRSAKAIKAGIELTKSVLYAYRQVAFYTYNNTNDDTLTIKDGISSAELLYQSHNKKYLYFKDKNIPESISGFSNYFILATLLPLLENAICATEADQQIEIEYEYIEENHIFKISNPVKNIININNLYKDGFSSKNEKGKPHKGTGLSIVRNLIANIENSKLEFEFNNNILIAILKIHNNTKK